MATINEAQLDPSFQKRLEYWGMAYRVALDRPVLGAGYKATENASIFHRYNPDSESAYGRAVHSAYLQVLAEHGFVGLGLFGLMFVMAINNCRWTRKKCSSIDDLYWLAKLASMLEIGFFGFAVGAAALSIAYYDLFIVLIAVSSVLRTYAEQELKALEDADKGPALTPLSLHQPVAIAS